MSGQGVWHPPLRSAPWSLHIGQVSLLPCIPPGPVQAHSQPKALALRVSHSTCLEFCSPQISAVATHSHPAGLCSVITNTVKPSLNTLYKGSNPHTCIPYLPLFFSTVFILMCLFTMSLLHKNVSSVKAGTSFYLLLNMQHLQCIAHSGNSINI